MAFQLRNRNETHGPFDTKDELLQFWQGLDAEEDFWIEDLSKTKKLSKSDQ